jgi:hypothetical protein
MVSLCQQRDKVAEHVAGARESVEQQQDGGARTACLPVENLNAMDISGTVIDGHDWPFDFGRMSTTRKIGSAT